jgi:hypothetical protein
MTSGTPACPPGWPLVFRRPRFGERAGHSVGVLMQVYTKCLDGGDQVTCSQVGAILGTGGTGNEEGTDGRMAPVSADPAGQTRNSPEACARHGAVCWGCGG